ncbi:MAG: type II toxin-antitoxin system RelE/ParE family toxin [Deltaproteobacteria bacterium]|nr:type II toxin-antitoxin system RelE/ParE family toxin [Deltaproteobacteria bacterium]
MPALKWVPEALEDLERLFALLREKNPAAAAGAAQTILDGANRLVTPPRLGRPMPDKTGRRELFVPFASGAYVLRYMLEQRVAYPLAFSTAERRVSKQECEENILDLGAVLPLETFNVGWVMTHPTQASLNRSDK